MSTRPTVIRFPALATPGFSAAETLARNRTVIRRIAHDLNNVLILPLALGSLLADTLPAGQGQSDALAIVAAVTRARDLVRVLQTLAGEGGGAKALAG